MRLDLNSESVGNGFANERRFFEKEGSSFAISNSSKMYNSVGILVMTLYSIGSFLINDFSPKLSPLTS